MDRGRPVEMGKIADLRRQPLEDAREESLEEVFFRVIDAPAPAVPLMGPTEGSVSRALVLLIRLRHVAGWRTLWRAGRVASRLAGEVLDPCHFARGGNRWLSAVWRSLTSDPVISSRHGSGPLSVRWRRIGTVAITFVRSLDRNPCRIRETVPVQPDRSGFPLRGAVPSSPALEFQARQRIFEYGRDLVTCGSRREWPYPDSFQCLWGHCCC